MGHRVGIFLTAFGNIIATITQEPVSMTGKIIFTIVDPIEFEDDPLGPYTPLYEFMFKDGYRDIQQLWGHSIYLETIPNEAILNNYNHAVIEMRRQAAIQEPAEMEEVSDDFDPPSGNIVI